MNFPQNETHSFKFNPPKNSNRKSSKLKFPKLNSWFELQTSVGQFFTSYEEPSNSSSKE
jgi:hypothetical protein